MPYPEFVIRRPQDTNGLCEPVGQHWELWFFWRLARSEGPWQLVRILKLVNDGA